MTAATPFEHEAVPRLTDFFLPPEQAETPIQEVYAALVDDRVRNELILTDLIQASRDGRSPLLLTGRTEHLKYFESELAGRVNNVFILKVAFARNNDDRQQRQSRLCPSASQESFWRPVVTSAKDSTTLAWIRSFWRCPSLGRERYSNT
jgi:hypothetical protein